MSWNIEAQIKYHYIFLIRYQEKNIVPEEGVMYNCCTCWSLVSLPSRMGGNGAPPHAAS